MPDYNNNTPSTFGRASGVFVPFTYGGHSFPQGVAPDLVHWFTVVLNAVVPHINGGLHPGVSSISGDWGGEVRANTNDPNQESFHEFGMAADVNAPWNPNGTNPGTGLYQLQNPVGAIVYGLGGLWGGQFNGTKDPMHIECHLHTSEVAAWNAAHPLGAVTPAKPPVVPARQAFPLPAGYYFGLETGPNQSISGEAPSGSDAKYRPYIKEIQTKLGIPADGLYGPQTDAHVMVFQHSHGITADGLVGPVTWAQLGL